MAVKTAQLGIEVAVDVAGVDAAFESAGSSAKGMADDIKSAASDADTAASRLDGVASSAENMDDKAGKATGALGALSSGFELVGAEKYAGALQGAALATDFMSGAGQALTLVMELESVAKAKAVVQTVAHTAATKAASAASKVAAAGQWALNAALAANPVGLVVVAVAALVAGLVLAYKKSETFRSVVKGAMSAVRAAVDPVIKVVTSLADWVGSKVPGSASSMKEKVVPLIKLAFLPITLQITVIKELIEFARDKVPAAFESMKNKAAPYINAVLTPIEKVKSAVDNLLDAIANIDLPDLPDLNPFSRTAGGKAGAVAETRAGTSATGGDLGQLIALLIALLSRPAVQVNALDIGQLIKLLRRNGYVIGKAT